MLGQISVHEGGGQPVIARTCFFVFAMLLGCASEPGDAETVTAPVGALEDEDTANQLGVDPEGISGPLCGSNDFADCRFMSGLTEVAWLIEDAHFTEYVRNQREAGEDVRVVFSGLRYNGDDPVQIERTISFTPIQTGTEGNFAWGRAPSSLVCEEFLGPGFGDYVVLHFALVVYEVDEKLHTRLFNAPVDPGFNWVWCGKPSISPPGVQ